MGSKHILAIGLRPGDVEISCGAVLAAHRSKGNKVTILHLTDSDNDYLHSLHNKLVHQSEIEAIEAADIIKANVVFGRFQPHDLHNNNQILLFVSNLIRKLCPTSIVTHWNQCKDSGFNQVNTLINKALFLCESSDVKLEYPAYEGVKNLYFTEHFTDKDEFRPYIYINISDFMNTWYKMLNCYEYFHNKGFPYIDYYKALAKIRGGESYFNFACAFDISAHWNKQFNDLIP